MAKRKYKVGDYVYSKKQRVTSRVTAVRDYGAYITRSSGHPLCCPWDDLIDPTKEQKREYIIQQSKQRGEQKRQEADHSFKPFHGGKEPRRKHKVVPKAAHIKMLKQILTSLNLKYPVNIKSPKSKLQYPISAVWHCDGIQSEQILVTGGLKTVKKRYNYGWTLVYDWMWLEDDSKFNAYVKAMQIKYAKHGLKLDCVFKTHEKVVYSGLIAIQQKGNYKLKLGLGRAD